MVTAEKDKHYWDKHAKNYDRSMALLGRPIPRMVELAGEATRGLGRVLEVAAGTGLVTPALAAGAAEVIATDYSAAMVAALERRVREAGVANVRCQQADLYALQFDDGTFDAVVAANVLHLVPDLPGALAALRRVVKPGGRGRRSDLLPRRDGALMDRLVGARSDWLPGAPALHGEVAAAGSRRSGRPRDAERDAAGPHPDRVCRGDELTCERCDARWSSSERQCSERAGARWDSAPAINRPIAAHDHADDRRVARPALHARRRHRSSLVASLRPDDEQHGPSERRRSC